ncbi:MAG: CaiB/BaiF CoA transferase family protein [Burkholderiaceae bacterium]
MTPPATPSPNFGVHSSANPSPSANPPSPTQSPLAGITVLDLTRLLPGPVATMHLADMGATIIKIEDKGAGDYARTMMHVRRELSQMFIAVNRGKHIMHLDLKQPEDHQTFLSMVDNADVVIESFRPGVMQRLGLGWDVLKARKPSLVMCAISGYGQTGPLSQQAGHDLNYIGYAGMLAQMADETGRPVISNLQIGDLLGGALSAVQGILAALLAVKMGKPGRFVDVSMTDAVFAHHLMPLFAVNHVGHAAPPARDFLTGGLPCYNIYRCSDDRYMAVGALELKFWQGLCEVIQRPDLKTQHWAHGQVVGSDEAMSVRDQLAAIFASRTQAEWHALFEPADCCVTPVLSPEEALHHPNFIARGMVRTEQHPTEGEYLATGPAVQFLD